MIDLNRPDLDNETKDMIKQFVAESYDALDNNEQIVENLQEENNSEFVNAIFRVFHTLKGLSGFFGMNVINRVTHEAETLLDKLRKQNSRQPEEIITLIYSAFDLLRGLLSYVDSSFSDAEGEDEAENMIIILKDAIQKIELEGSSPIIEASVAYINGDTDNDNQEIVEEEQIDEIAINQSQETLVVDEGLLDDSMGEGLISQEMKDQFFLDASEMISDIEQNLVNMEKTQELELIGDTFRLVHSLKGNAGFMGYSEIEEFASDMETILQSIKSGELPADETIISILLSNLEMIATRVANQTTGGSTSDTETGEFMQNQEIPAEIIMEEAAEERLQEQSPEIKSSIRKKKEEQPKKPAPKPAAVQEESQPNHATSIQKKDIRVDTQKIDKLFDLVGELITIESMVTNNPELKGMELPSFNKSARMLNKITRELQEVTMSVRMMPLESLFNRMKRLVRDVALKMGKKVDLKISGQETEMDKNVIDEIADPLVHILRNSVDHGIESPQERKENDKTETGTINLSARYAGNEILISVSDDGAGINREKVYAKAVEKELIADGAELSDNEVYKLIFEPGFSTADKVTDISGRGVGMDVVKRNIEKLRGSIDVESSPGAGSTVTMRIPLTLAILESMVIRIGNSQFALPILSVVESFKVSIHNITTTMDGLEVVKVRHEVIPVIRLHEIFNKEPDSEQLEEGIMITIESRNKKVCLFADEIIGQQQAVVKSLTDYIGKVPGIMGCMVLGDGGIGLILDIESLILLAELPAITNQ